MKWKCWLLGHVWLFATPPSVGFSRLEYWSGLPFPCPGHLPSPGIRPGPPTLQADSLPTGPTGKPFFLALLLNNLPGMRAQGVLLLSWPQRVLIGSLGAFLVWFTFYFCICHFSGMPFLVTRIGGKRQADLVPIPPSTKDVLTCSSLASERAARGFKAKMCYVWNVFLCLIVRPHISLLNVLALVGRVQSRVCE